jgi:uncharacterized membrane protein
MSLRTAPASTRVFVTMVLLVLGLGYLLAQVYLYSKEVKPKLDDGHGLVQGVAYTYNGLPTAEPKLLVSLRGSMSSTVNAAEVAAIKTWIDGGATQDGYTGIVANIIENNCGSCHGDSGYPPVVNNFETAVELTAPDTGVDIAKLARMTHIHLLGIPILFFMMGSMFIRTRYSEPLKVVIVILPFAGVIWDIAHWWLTKLEPSAAVGIIIGGVIMGSGFGLQWLLTLIDVWKPYKAPEA